MFLDKQITEADLSQICHDARFRKDDYLPTYPRMNEKYSIKYNKENTKAIGYRNGDA